MPDRRPATHARTFRLLLVLPLLLAAGCASADLGRTFPPGAGEPMSRTELYFGTLKPDGSEVSDAEWRTFLDTAITSRFPDGLTVLDAAGQYRGSSGRIDRERSKLVILLHDGSASSDGALRAIVDSYKRSFRQESVLRVDDVIRASF